MTIVVSAWNLKNDKAGIKYVEYNGTIEQMQKILKWQYTFSNQGHNCGKVSDFKNETAEIQICLIQFCKLQ